MIRSDNKDYKNWFVIQVTTNKEYYLKKFIEEHAAEKIKMFIFSRELIFERQHKLVKCISPLFPGYIFIHKKAGKAIQLIKNYLQSEFIKPICFKSKSEKCEVCFQDKSPCMVYQDEMEFFLSIADDSGVITLSHGIESVDGEDKVKDINIVNGPLKQLSHKLLWINQKKKKACVEIELFKRTVKVNLGFDMLRCS